MLFILGQELFSLRVFFGCSGLGDLMQTAAEGLPGLELCTPVAVLWCGMDGTGDGRNRGENEFEAGGGKISAGQLLF